MQIPCWHAHYGLGFIVAYAGEHAGNAHCLVVFESGLIKSCYPDSLLTPGSATQTAKKGETWTQSQMSTG